MAVYALGGKTSQFTTSTAGAELRASSTDRPKLLRWAHGVNVSPASAFTLALGRPAAIGVTPTTPVTVIAEDDAEPVGTAQLVTAGWGTGPTAPANFFRRFRIFHATRIFWEFPQGLAIDVSKSLVLWNLVGTAVAVELHLVLDE